MQETESREAITAAMLEKYGDREDADMESFLTVLNSFNIHIFAGGQGSWVEPNGRHYAPLPRLPWQEDDVAEVPQ